MGMMAWFVHAYIGANELTPDYILIMFITATLGVAWTIFTIFSYHRSSSNSHFVSLIDLAFAGTLIAAVYQLRFIARADCTHVSATDDWVISAGSLITLSGQGIHIETDKPCAMLKASFALGIMNVVFFFFSAVLAWMHGGRLRGEEKDRRYVRETTVHRHQSRSAGRGSSRPRSGSHHSRHSSHSHAHSRPYV